jgi:prevent-host-death family protein
MKRVPATEFKAKCLSLLDEVNESGETIEITKRGRPVATLHPAPKARRTTRGMFKGKMKIVGDIINVPMDWKYLRLEKPKKSTPRARTKRMAS